MANEATITSGLSLRKSSGTAILIDYQSRPSSFRATVDGTKGPTPGSVTVLVTGTIIEFSELTIPGLCRLSNQGTTNYYEYGIYDPQTDVFYPLGEVLPGESYVIRFSRNLAEEYVGTGSGTSAATNKFMLKAFSGSTTGLVEAFEA